MSDNYGKKTDTLSEYVIILAFPWQQWLRKAPKGLYIIRTLPVLFSSFMDFFSTTEVERE
jgi:hypothetical protein